MPERSTDIHEQIYLLLDINVVKIPSCNVSDDSIIIKLVIAATKPADGYVVART
jgi:hypothetical protein